MDNSTIRSTEAAAAAVSAADNEGARLSRMMELLRRDPTPELKRFMAKLRPDRGRGRARLEVCELCLTCHADKERLWRHVRAAHGDYMALTCQVPGCGRAFSTLAASIRHAERHLSVGGRCYACELCGRGLANLAASRRHAAASHPETLAALCGICGRYVGDVAALAEHVRSHVHDPDLRTGGGGPLRCNHVIRCDVCGKRYGNNRLMSAHRLVHGIP